MNKAVLLLSGGLDSLVSLACIKDKYEEILTLTFDYGQKPVKQEIQAAKSIADFYKVKNEVITLDWLGKISFSALNSDKEVPNVSENLLLNSELMKETSNSVWVPNRNALFINIAACYAEAQGFNDIIIGANKEEGETFIDNSLEFIYAINYSLKYSVNTEIKVIAPLIELNKSEIVEKGIQQNVPFNLMYSCYTGDSVHCAKCESCVRLKRALKNCGKNDIIETIFKGEI